MSQTINTLSRYFKRCQKKHFEVYAAAVSCSLKALCQVRQVRDDNERICAMQMVVGSLYAKNEQSKISRNLRDLCSNDAFDLYDILARRNDEKMLDSNIVSGSVSYLEEIQRDIERRFGLNCCSFNKRVRTAVFDLLERVFDYDSFRSGKVLTMKDGKSIHWGCSKENSWGAGAFIFGINPLIRYCPYCNADTIYAVRVRKDRLLPYASALDHFLPRSAFPYFGISLCNLVPSCTRCNSPLKGKSLVTFSNAPHPYRESLYDLFGFYVNSKNVTGIGCSYDFDIEIRFRGSETQRNRAKALFKDVLHIDEVYSQLFKQETLDMLKKIRALTRSYVKCVFGSFLETNRDIQYFMPELFVPTDKMPLYRLSKLTRDLARQFGIKINSLP